jgi:hypothetical protein
MSWIKLLALPRNSKVRRNTATKMLARSWMGSSLPVALSHSLQIRDEDFAKTAKEPTPETVQNRVQHPAAVRGSVSHALPQKTKNPADSSGERVLANRRKSLQRNGLPPVGLEPTTNRLRVCCSTN